GSGSISRSRRPFNPPKALERSGNEVPSAMTMHATIISVIARTIAVSRESALSEIGRDGTDFQRQINSPTPPRPWTAIITRSNDSAPPASETNEWTETSESAPERVRKVPYRNKIQENMARKRLVLPIPPRLF